MSDDDRISESRAGHNPKNSAEITMPVAPHFAMDRAGSRSSANNPATN